MLQRARAKVPRETGLLQQSLVATTRVFPRASRVVAFVGPRSDIKTLYVVRRKGKWAPTRSRANPMFYAHLVEFGTVRSQAKPFLNPALRAGEAAAKAAFRRALGKAIRRAAA